MDDLTQLKQCEMFEKDLDQLIIRYTEEFDLPVTFVLGLFSIKSHEITENAFYGSED